jgi:hypothetical protein
VTEQGNLTSDDVDDVIVNEEIVTTNVTHGSHGHDDKVVRMSKANKTWGCSQPQCQSHIHVRQPAIAVL